MIAGSILCVKILSSSLTLKLLVLRGLIVNDKVDEHDNGIILSVLKFCHQKHNRQWRGIGGEDDNLFNGIIYDHLLHRTIHLGQCTYVTHMFSNKKIPLNDVKKWIAEFPLPTDLK